MNDIDLTGVAWISKRLGTGSEFNGNGYTISNLTINSDATNQALFLSNRGSIKNLNISNANVSGTAYAAILVGENVIGGTISNCSVEGTVNASGNNCGLLAARNDGTIKNVSATGTVVSTSTSVDAAVGGLVGFNRTADAKIEYASADVNVVAAGRHCGGLVGTNSGGTIKNVTATGTVEGASWTGGLVGSSLGESALVENASASVKVTATGDGSGGLVGSNSGTIKNASASGDVSGTSNVGGFVGSNSANALIENCSVSGNVNSTGNNVGGFAGSNGGTIANANSAGDVLSTSTAQWGKVGGFVGSNSGANASINNASAIGNVTSAGGDTGGFVGNIANGASIYSSYALGDVKGGARGTGGFAGEMINGIIESSYAKGDATSDATNNAGVGGFLGWSDGKDSGTDFISDCYSTGSVNGKYQVGGFVGVVYYSGLSVENSYSTGTANGKAGIFAPNKGMSANSYVLSDDESKIGTTVNGVTFQSADWFEDGYNLQFLGSAYDYYYNPPELWSNKEAHPEEFTQFQVGANSGEKHTLNMNMTFRMYDFYGDVTSVESSEATLERVDAFKERLSEHRSMIGSVRNRLDSVMESQSIRLENLNSSHSTIVDTDFAAETAKLTRNQILQQATSSLLSQANFMPNIALQLLG